MTGRSRAVLALLLAGLLPACGTSGGGTLSQTTAPAAPKNLSTQRGNGEVTISWTASPGSGSFDVLRSSTTGGPYFPVAGGLSVAGTSFSDTTVLNGIRYYYAVKAANLFGQSAPSAEVSVVPEIAGTKIVGARSTSLAVLEDGSLWSWGGNQLGELGDGTTRVLSTVATRVSILKNVRAVASQWDHFLAAAEDGTVWSWGHNKFELIGPITFEYAKRTPLQIPGLSGAVDVATGLNHSMVLTSDGTVWTWGKGMGPGGADSPTPTPVASLANVVKICAGTDTCYALLADGTVRAWGANGNGQLGVGFGSTTVPTPTLVVNLSDVTAITAGAFFGVALRSDGTVWAWGNGATAVQTPAPVKVPVLSGVTAIAAGFAHVLALRSDGTMMGWGSNSKFQLGNSVSGSTPQPLADLVGITHIAAGSEHSLAIGSNGEIWCWGNNDLGQLGSGTGALQTVPVRVSNLTDVSTAAAGSNHCLAIRTDSTVWGWGDNGQGQIISPPGGVSSYPFRVQVTTLPAPAVTAVACGDRFSVARRSNGTLLSCGVNGFGQLGSGAVGPPGGPVVQVLNLNGTTPDNTIVAVSCGSSHTLALSSSGLLWSWGNNAQGQLGTNSMAANNPTPVQVSGLSGVTAFAAGPTHSLAVVGSGPAATVWAWGSNSSSELGNTGPLSRVPVQVLSTDLAGVTAVAAGDGFSLALVGSGPTSTIWAWGNNSSGQHGDGLPIVGPAVTEVPRQVVNLTGVTAIAAGQYHALALLSDKTVWCWGGGSAGQLGSGLLQPSSVPLPATGLSDITAIGAGTQISLALDSSGACWAWGSNQVGQVGIGTVATSMLPIQVTK